MDNLKETDVVISDDEWKIDLREQLIKGIIGSAEEKQSALYNTGMYYQCSAPETLYKFYSDNQQNLDAVFNNKMWYSSPSEFNDVFDCEITVDKKSILDSALKMAPKGMTIRPGSPMWKKANESVIKSIREFRTIVDGVRNQTGVACFSESSDSLLMWSHYAHNHKGMCVEYNLLDINKAIGFTAIPVIYSENRVSIKELDLDNIDRDSLILIIRALSSKSIEWSYEKEWRIIRDNKACGELWNYDKNGALLDMVSPLSITLGCEATEEFSAKIKERCESNRINLYRMEKDAEQYKLNKKEILKFDE